MKLSKLARKNQSYFFVNFLKKIKDFKTKTGKKIIDLTIGTPTFLPSKKYLQKLKSLIEEKNIFFYPSYQGDPTLKKALNAWYQKRFGVSLGEESFLPVLGGKDAISHLPPLVLDKEEEILVPDPGYPGFSGTVNFFGGKVVTYQLSEEHHYLLNFKELSKKITKKTKAIFVNYPHNPTGAVADLPFLKKLVDFCLDYNLALFYDNAYSEITFDGYQAPSIFQIKEAKKIALEIGSFSKTFSFAGFRIGWIAGEEKLIKSFLTIKSQFDSGVPLIFQKLVAFSLKNFDNDWYKKMISEYKKRRDVLVEFFKKIVEKVTKPKGGFYLWVKIPKNFTDSLAFSDYLFKKYQVAVTPGIAFGKKGKKYIRASFSGVIEEKFFKEKM